jgi:hypothetical protein
MLRRSQAVCAGASNSKRGALTKTRGAIALACAALALSSIVVLSPRDAFAQANYRSSPSGGRSALMGGTGIALGRDGSAPFLNPATILNVGDSGIAFSVNFYSYSSTRLTNFHQPGAVDGDHFGDLRLPDTSFQQSRLEALPSTLCLFLDAPNVGGKKHDPRFRKGSQRLAACLGSVEQQNSAIAAARYTGAAGGLQSDQAAALTRRWNRFVAGPTYSVYVTEDIALGLSIHGIDTTYSQTLSASGVTRDASGRAITSDFGLGTDAFSIDVAAIAGLLWRPDRYHSFGIGITTPSLHVASGYDSTFHTQYAAGADQYALLRTGKSGSFFAPSPLRVGAGFGATYGKWRVEVDATYYFPRDEGARANVHTQEIVVRNGMATASTADDVIVQKTDGIVNGAFGAEFFLNRTISVLGGASTDFSAIPPLSQTPNERTIPQARVNRVAGSLGVGTYTDGSELLVGAEVSYANGRATAVDTYVLPNRLALVTQDTVTVLFIIAGSTNLNTLRHTVDRLTQMVVP